MADKEKKPEFVVTDRRLFSTDGELRQDVVEDEERRAEREREKSEAQRLVNESARGTTTTCASKRRANPIHRDRGSRSRRAQRAGAA